MDILNEVGLDGVKVMFYLRWCLAYPSLWYAVGNLPVYHH